MKKLLKIGGILALAGIIGLTYIWFFVYNKPHRDYEKATADYVVTAGECYQKYSGGTDVECEYTGKVLEISGIPSSIENQDSLVIVVFAFNSGDFGDEGIRCTMLPNHHNAALALTSSKEIKIKGKCQGYNDTDVILEHCSIVN